MELFENTLSESDIRKFIEKYGLKASIKRELSLFFSSCLADAYINKIKEVLGFGYNAYLAFGFKGDYYNMFNIEHLAENAEKHFNEKTIKLIRTRAKSIFKEAKENFERAKALQESDPKGCLRIIAELYPGYSIILGTYNAFWRILGEEKNKYGLNESIISEIGKERCIVGEMYPKTELLLQECTGIIGKNDGFDGGLLQYLTSGEMCAYLSSSKISEEKLRISKKRSECYLHLAAGNKEYIITDKTIVTKLWNEFFNINKNINKLKGSPAHPGKVRGKAFVAGETKELPDEPFILVASHTNPKMVPLLGKCIAIITDEGGVLSHAAIISRELKLPCIIAAKIASKVLRTGDFIDVDADTGIIRIIQKK